MPEREGTPIGHGSRIQNGIDLLHDTRVNKGTAFTEDERDRLGPGSRVLLQRRHPGHGDGLSCWPLRGPPRAALSPMRRVRTLTTKPEPKDLRTSIEAMMYQRGYETIC